MLILVSTTEAMSSGVNDNVSLKEAIFTFKTLQAALLNSSSMLRTLTQSIAVECETSLPHFFQVQSKEGKNCIRLHSRFVAKIPIKPSPVSLGFFPTPPFLKAKTKIIFIATSEGLIVKIFVTITAGSTKLIFMTQKSVFKTAE